MGLHLTQFSAGMLGFTMVSERVASLCFLVREWVMELQMVIDNLTCRGGLEEWSP